MNDAIHLKYLMVSPEDLLWGLAVNSVGFKGSQMDAWVRDNFFNKVSLYQSAIDTAKDQEALFQQSLGGIVAHLVSLAHFLNRAKILIADQFRTITHTANPIKQIAYEMGFKNEDYFFTARELTQGKSL